VISAMLDVKAYLDRIAYRGSTAPNSETLRALHRAHLLAVPFENLDIALGRRIAMDLDAFVRKVVERRRGGFCYELNGAFAALLRALEFKVTLLSARVVGEGGRESPEFDHLCLRVELEESWLADVGFGELFLEPLRLHSKVGQTDPPESSRSFRAIQDSSSKKRSPMAPGKANTLSRCDRAAWKSLRAGATTTRLLQTLTS